MRLALAAIVILGLEACTKKTEELQVFNTIPDFILTAQSGEHFESRKQLKGKVWIADFIFTTCPGPCPRMSRQMKQIQDGVAGTPDIKLVSFTVDPENDTPAALEAYARRYGADPARWTFLTGDRVSINRLSKDAFMLQNLAGNVDHSTRFALVDREGRVRKYYQSSEAGAIPTLIAEAKALSHANPSANP